jgi:transcriptional regulator with XRE-family HTH domain
MVRRKELKLGVQRKTTSGDGMLGLRLRAARVEKGWSQSMLGEKLGITFQQVQKYEKGTNRVSASRLMQIAALLDVSMSSLLMDSDAKIAAGQFAVDKMSLKMLKQLKLLPDYIKPHILALMIAAIENPPARK